MDDGRLGGRNESGRVDNSMDPATREKVGACGTGLKGKVASGAGEEQRAV